MDLKHVLATNLRRFRHERGLTQEDLAGLTGLSLRYIGSVERGRVAASITVLGRLAAALQVEACELLMARPATGSNI
jgi:transcriptional regulator with XRE-family HTH domain